MTPSRTFDWAPGLRREAAARIRDARRAGSEMPLYYAADGVRSELKDGRCSRHTSFFLCDLYDLLTSMDEDPR